MCQAQLSARAPLSTTVRHHPQAMAYCLHIERAAEKPIALCEWQAAIQSTQGVRLFAAEAHIGTNPTTGEILSMRAGEGDAEVYLPESGEWTSVFRWFGESAAFAPRVDVIDPAHPTWKAAVALATFLGAGIRGDEGETYDFATGNVADA
jgi:hypothetical protein